MFGQGFAGGVTDHEDHQDQNQQGSQTEKDGNVAKVLDAIAAMRAKASPGRYGLHTSVAKVVAIARDRSIERH